MDDIVVLSNQPAEQDAVSCRTRLVFILVRRTLGVAGVTGVIESTFCLDRALHYDLHSIRILHRLS